MRAVDDDDVIIDDVTIGVVKGAVFFANDCIFLAAIFAIELLLLLNVFVTMGIDFEETGRCWLFNLFLGGEGDLLRFLFASFRNLAEPVVALLLVSVLVLVLVLVSVLSLVLILILVLGAVAEAGGT